MSSRDVGTTEDSATASDDSRGLIARAMSGDADAFAALYDRHAPTMLALGTRLLGGPGDAQDLVHDVFLEAWRQVRQYDPARGSVRTWLLVRLRSRGLDRLKRQRNGPVRFMAEPPAQPAPERPAEHGASMTIQRGLDALPPRVRQVLELSYLEGHSLEAIATGLCTPLSTIKSRRARGLALLQAWAAKDKEFSA